MPSITFDGQSFLLDGRRHWLVAAQVCYTTTPRALWADRLRAAKQAGFNAVLVPCPWNVHESRPNVFDFTGERDIRTFVETAGELGLSVILRVGPAIGDGWDLSGIPAWAASLKHPEKTEPDPKVAKLRGGAPEFLEAVSRWFSNLSAQVKGLQAAQGGPITLAQVEHHWFCGDDDAASRYLVELGRFLRESGFTVPFVNANNLFQPVEGEIDGWSGDEHLLAMFRQMRVVSPQNPRILIDFTQSRNPAWGEPIPTVDPLATQRKLAEAAAAGAQFVVGRFAPGTYPEFFSGRRAGDPDGFIAAHPGESNSMLTCAGLRTPEYFITKRLATFCSRFGRVLAALESGYQPVGILPGGATTSIVHASGQRGSVAFVFAPADHKGALAVDLLLPDGRAMSVSTGDQKCAWFLFDAHLHARSTLDFCSLQPFAQVGKVFVCFGPAGQKGLLSINGAELPVEVPTGKTPFIEELENTTVVVCNEAMIDAAYAADNAVYIGVAGLDADDHPVAHPDFRTHFVISAEGKVDKSSAGSGKKHVTPDAPALDEWSSADQMKYIDGDSERYATIDAPASLHELGASYGYGWMRFRFPGKGPKKAHAGFFDLNDRAHAFLDGEFADIAGVGPGASGSIIGIPLKKKKHTLTLLIDNLGRVDGGSMFEPRKGMLGHIVEAASFKAAGKAAIEQGEPIAPLTFRTPMMGMRTGVRTHPDRITWTFQHRRKSPIFMEIAQCPAPTLVVVNNTVIQAIDPGERAVVRLETTSEESPFKAGKNVVQLAIIADPVAGGGDPNELMSEIDKATTFYEGEEIITEKAEIAFAKWEPPADEHFHSMTKTAVRKAAPEGVPTWWRTSFVVRSLAEPLFLDLAGMTKGQIYLNGRNLSRYFVSTKEGKDVGPVTRQWLPEPWLKVGEPNVITIFDEHGAAPGKCKLVYDVSAGVVV